MAVLFDIKRVATKDQLKQLIEKTKKAEKPKSTSQRGGSLITRIKNICDQVQKRLGHYQDELQLIQTEQELIDYIDASIVQGKIAIDTETTGLDPFTDQIVGVCIYTYNQKPAYVPINHISYITNVRLDGQLTEQQVAKQLQRLVDAKTEIIMFNAKFDVRVIRHQLGVYLTPAWCGFIAGKCLKNNELEGNLKYLWKKYCSPDKDAEHFTFDKMFDGLKFNLIPLTTAYLYAAKDALMTMELYDFQKPYLTETDQKCIDCGFQKLAKLYNEIELPIIPIVADIEDAGVAIDVQYCQELSVKYNALLKEAESKFHKELENYKDQIQSYLATHPSTKLEDPINIASPAQLAELFYDILKVPSVSKKSPRGTGEEILEKMGHPLGKLILDYRGVAKLLNTYIDKMPAIVNKKTGRIHCSFNQYGTDTGRFSSNNPNLQNIPSHNKDIRPMFIGTTNKDITSQDCLLCLLYDDIIATSTGNKDSQDLQIGDTLCCLNGLAQITSIQIEDIFVYVTLNCDVTINVKRAHLLIGADYSQQEPKITADLSDDEQFMADCKAGKDAYGTIASIAFNKPYEECLEFYLDENGNKTHEVNKEGKARRNQAKVILLGICYGKTMKSIAEDLNTTEEKATEIYNAVLTNISGLRNFMEYSQAFCKQYGYVETKWGRRRHIPDMQLEPYEITSVGVANFDPFFDSEELGVIDDTERKKQQILQDLLKAKYKQQKDKIKLNAEKEGFKIKENTKKIEDATRQVVNARVQGSAADQTKIAMRLIGNDETLKKLDFKMVLLVHDEIIAECPFITAYQAIPIFKQCMLDAAKDLRSGAACDETSALKWYGKDFEYEDINHETLQKVKQELYK